MYRISLPSRLYNGCGLSRMTNTISAGILPCVWSPSFWNVTRVPDFQPGLIAMFTNLSSFFGVPSACSIRREIFIFLTQPLLISSSVAYKSCSIGGSCVFVSFLGVCTLNECDLWRKWENEGKKREMEMNKLRKKTANFDLFHTLNWQQSINSVDNTHLIVL